MFTTFLNCRLCIDGELINDQLVVSEDTGLILPRTGYIGGEAIDLEDAIIAPGLIELHTNGSLGFHFTNFTNNAEYASSLDTISRHLVSQGVTGFYATIPTVSRSVYENVLPVLKPREISQGASLLGAHVEGPYLHPSKKGAHDASLLVDGTESLSTIYGPAIDKQIVKLATVAPELDGSSDLIRELVLRDIRVSLGHSAASYDTGLDALLAGATCLTHTMNAMAPFHHREPGLAGLTSLPPNPGSIAPYFTMIPDGHHLHPSVASLLFKSNPEKCIFITDSIELAGMPDGGYPGNAQISHKQQKIGSRVTIAGTDTLIGGCASLEESVRNVMSWSGCNVAQAVRCVTQNVADLMGDASRGRLEAGRRADFVVMNDEGEILQTWIAGVKVWER